MYILFFVISLLASVIGAICGIGGGVIIKPVLDAISSDGTKVISFLSGCTVLAMSLYSVGATLVKRENMLEAKTATPMAIGAAVGGVLGKELFQQLTRIYEQAMVGRVQAICLLVVTMLTLLYTLMKNRVKTHHITNLVVCLLVGLVLGMMSAFLGIGGGPINLMVLSFLFSMDAKKAAQNSLYIILISQITSLISTFITKSVPAFEPLMLGLMILGGIGGAITGRKINKKIDNAMVNKLFCVAMGIIIIICVYNTVK